MHFHELTLFLHLIRLIIIFSMSDYELERLILGDEQLSKYFSGLGQNPLQRQHATNGRHIPPPESGEEGSYSSSDDSSWSGSECSDGSGASSASPSVAGADESVPAGKRKRSDVDRREAHVLRGGEFPPHPEGEQKRLEGIVQKLGYWIDQLTEERRGWEAILRDRVVFGVPSSSAK